MDDKKTAVPAQSADGAAQTAQNVNKGEKDSKIVIIPASLFASKPRNIFVNIVMPALALISVADIVSCLLQSQTTSYLTFFLFLMHSFICIAACFLVRDSERSSFYTLIFYCCYFLLVLCVPLVLGIISHMAYTQYFYAFSAITGMSRLVALTLSVGTWLTSVMRAIFAVAAFLFFAYFLREIVKLQPLFNGEKKPAQSAQPAKKAKPRPRRPASSDTADDSGDEE